MVKPNFEEKVEELKKNNGQGGALPNGIKKCPFQSSHDHEVPCSPNCALYKSGKQDGYQCPLTELSQIAWVLKGCPQKGQILGTNFKKY